MREELTPAERRVLELVCLGLSGRAIAARLHRSWFTIKKHQEAIRAKYGANLIRAAVLYTEARALEGRGIVGPQPLHERAK